MSDDRETIDEEHTTRRTGSARRVVLRAGRTVEINAAPARETR